MTEVTNTIELATELTIAWLGNSNTRVTTTDVPAFLQAMHDTLTKLDAPETAVAETRNENEEYVPAVSVRKSLASPDHILSMIDGKPYRTLRRHLSSNGLTADEYRKRYNLKADYPMVAPTYSESRRAMAKTIGLGRKPRGAAASEE
ncbi:transcriptional regulator [Sphingomonas sp. Leaf22]|uniref:MucR family transcriptional regulator n=1 Tax=Sphingomonas sp. Leaf22 TaxID=1735687 RepID=UPI0006FA7EB4|nr:MucR family transcriptional regulator [Sphingomonas sp. Leaf22]KQM75854.1 transcriptional regulator [Sphingomonas sp. Leaf22]